MNRIDRPQDPLEPERKKDEKKPKLDKGLVAEIIELASEEVVGLGLARRIAQRLKERISQEYIEEIALLKAEQRKVLQFHSELSTRHMKLVERYEALEVEIKALRNSKD